MFGEEVEGWWPVWFVGRWWSEVKGEQGVVDGRGGCVVVLGRG